MKNSLKSVLLLCPLLLGCLTSCAPKAYTKLEEHLKTHDWVTMKKGTFKGNVNYKAQICISDVNDYEAVIGAEYRTNDNYLFNISNGADPIIIEDDKAYNEFKFMISYDNLSFKNIHMRSDWYIRTENKNVKEVRCLEIWDGSLNTQEQKDVAKAAIRLIDDTVNYFILNDLPLFIG